MKPLKSNLLSHTVIPAALVAVVAIAAYQTTLPAAKANPAAQVAQNPCAAKNPCNPCATKNPCAGKNPCNPCAAKNSRNPCAAAEAPELTTAEATVVYDCLKGEMRTAYARSGNKYGRPS